MLLPTSLSTTVMALADDAADSVSAVSCGCGVSGLGAAAAAGKHSEQHGCGHQDCYKTFHKKDPPFD
jgi:hypothetical protein